MTPRLFEKNAATFDNYGICPLTDAISCTVTEERNKGFFLDMEYPREGKWAEEIAVDRIILADPYDNADMAEPFRIVSVDYDMLGSMQIYAEHISYQLNSVLIGENAQDPGTRYPAKYWEVENRYLKSTNPFTFETDIADENGTVHKYGCDTPTALKTLLGGTKGSMIDLFGGELKWNRYKVQLFRSRGSDNGVKIAYSKNLTGLQYSVDMSNVYTGLVAYYKSGDTYVESALQTKTHSYSYSRDIAVDASSYFDSTPSVGDLNTLASNYLQANAPDPVVSVDVEFVPLWQTDEYKDYYGLEHVALCDTVQVIYPPLNLDLKAKVVKTVYNVLADRYDEISISTVKQTLTDTIFTLMKER